MRNTLLALTIFALATGLAQAETPNKKQRAFIDNITEAFVINERCDESRINHPLLAYLMDIFEISLNDVREGGRFWPTVETYSMIAASELTTHDEETLCEYLAIHYGPEGAIIPDFVKFK